MSENLLAGRIAQLRKEAGMTQEQLGNALGLTYQLRDTRPPEPELVESTRAIFRSYGFEVH